MRRHRRGVLVDDVRAGVILVLMVAFLRCAEDAGRAGTAAARDSSVVRASAIHVPTLRDVVLTREWVGRRILITGRCMRRPPGRGLDPPRTPTDWLLEADGVAIYVTGQSAPCAPLDDDSLVTIEALVGEDTLPSIGSLPAAPRRYLRGLDISRPR